MINTKYFADYFTNLFNEFGLLYDLHFYFVADEGGLKDAVKEYGKKPVHYTTGKVTMPSSQLMPIRSIRLNNYVLELELLIDTLQLGFDENGESINVNKVRDMVTQMISAVNGTTSSVMVDNVEYSQAMTMSTPIVGTKGEVGFIADALPMFITVNVSMFEDGINANEWTLRVNNAEVPFTSLVASRRRTAEQGTFTQETDSQTIMQAQGISFDGVMPALKTNPFSRLLGLDILKGGNTPLAVEIDTPIANIKFIGTFGDGTASLDLITNVGYNFSIVKAKENTLEYGEGWRVIRVYDARVDIDVEIIVHQGRHIIFWGDGTSEVVEATEDVTPVNHRYTNTDDYTIRVFGG